MATISTTAAAGHNVVGRRAFVVAVGVWMVGACVLAGWAPLGFSIVTVFVFAGPHNWMEARYFMGKMPARWGKLKGYFLSALVGVLVLTGWYAAFPWLAELGGWSNETWLSGVALWNTAVIAWITGLILLRSRQNPRRNWSAAVPVSLVLVAAVWLWPNEWGLVLVYLHPCVAFWFLDLELRHRHADWLVAYRCCVALVPVLLALLVWKLASLPSLPGEDGLTLRITHHAGAGILPGVSSHLLVSLHTFLEMLHYGVWALTLPALTLTAVPWNLSQVPLARRSPTWRVVLLCVLAVGLLAVLGFWAGFVADYPLTRDIYFTVALIDVLAEIPFLLRQL